MANYMVDVAKLLGVEIGEEFEVVFSPPCSCHATAMITNEGAKVINTDVYDMYNFKSYLLTHLLTGAYSIKHKPWKPNYNQDYWAVTATNGVLAHNSWTDCWMDITYYKLGNCYKTEAEAEANRDKWISFYESDEVLEV
jgi:hypothetical protein